MTRRGWLVTAALLGLATPATAERDPSCGTMSLVSTGGSVVYRLPHAFIRPGSDSVRVRGVALVRGTDYVLDPLRGELRLLRDPAPGDTLRIDACWLLEPPPLERERRHYRPPSPPGSAARADTVPDVVERAGVSRERLDDAGGATGMNLAVAGSKTLAIDFGSNQDAQLRQSLDLTLSGRLTPGMELTGVLSDRNTPLSAGGSTQDLQAFDRVLIELHSPTLDAQLGDIDVGLEQGEFTRLQRRLQGVSAAWRSGPSGARFAAANTPGQYRRAEFYGAEGVQGPYALADASGSTGVGIVPGSDIVTLDGERLTRGESADYFLDYDAGRLTFTSRRPISSSSRITVEYQFSSGGFHRRMLLGGGRWETTRGFVQFGAVQESDDRGRPVEGAFGATDLVTLEFAGDSAARAIAADVSPNGGDYDTVRVDVHLTYSYVGAGAGRFAVPFSRVGDRAGDYESYPVPGGIAYRYVGAGLGAYRVGRALPLPESHQLASVGGGARWGGFAAEVEGAVSRSDRNTLSTRDDGDNVGGAGRARLALETPKDADRIVRAGVSATLRDVDRRFQAFTPLGASFEAERWGLLPGADLDHRRETAIDAYAGLRGGGELKGSIGRLETPGGYDARRREASFARTGFLTLQSRYAWAHGRDAARRRPDGERERIEASVRLRGAWLEPSLRAETDTRRSPSDSLPAGARTRAGAIDLSTGSRLAWRASAGYELRRDALPSGLPGTTGFVDDADTRIVSSQLRSPEGRPVSGELRVQHRQRVPFGAAARTVSDLGALRLRGEDKRHGLNGQLDLELSGDGESRRERRVVFAGPGLGAYDSLGNFTGTGDYLVAIVVSPDFDRVSRAVTSARLGWDFTPGPAWAGSRLGFDYESETRRRGDLHAMDPWVSPSLVRIDGGLARARVLQRLESEIAPGSRASAFRLRLEREVSADRSFENFGQTLDSRSADLRWRARPGSITTTELSGVLRRQAAAQALAGAGSLDREIRESGGTALIVVTPDTRLRAAATVEATWSRPAGATERTRVLRLGPDVGLAIGRRGHVEFTARRAFVSGAALTSLLPTSEPAGPARWDVSSRVDTRVHETTVVGVQLGVTERDGRKTRVTGRAEVRALF